MGTIENQIRSLGFAIRKVWDGQSRLMGEIAAVLQELRSGPKSITQEIDEIPGRRAEYDLTGSVDFTIAQDGIRGDPVTMQVSQDGPFVATHYPLVAWFPNAPENTTNFGRWRPVSSWPLPDQVVDDDIIDIQYEMVDGGSQRNFQPAPRGLVLSRPDALAPLPVPTLYAPGAVVQFIPTYNRIIFDGDVAPTGGTLVVDIPGYRIINL